jgi:DNA-nicking Smr family endonuclease
MDFGDILDAWERMTAQPQGSKKQLKKQAEKDKAAGQPPPKPDTPQVARTDPITEWIRIHGVYDKDAEAGAEPAYETGAEAGRRRRRLLRKEPDAVIDLHGLTQAEAWTALDRFFEAGRVQGFEKLCVVHGKGSHSSGEGVLKQLTRCFIERCPFAGESGRAKAESGGSGATWVILKREKTC